MEMVTCLINQCDFFHLDIPQLILHLIKTVFDNIERLFFQNSKIALKGGKVTEADTSKRNIKSYTLTEDDYFNGYASRYLILHDTPFAELLSRE